MKFAIITHVPHGIQNKKIFAYAPYVKEMNIWTKFVDELIIVAPISLTQKTAINTNYNHDNIEFVEASKFNFLNLKSIFVTFLKLPKICKSIYLAMKKADHIHLRCPGNMGLLGCFIQILFPRKPKTAKYAGNWDPKSEQPISYKLQKWILSNTFLTKNIQVLVYGSWENQSKNIRPFFTATYSENEKIVLENKNFSDKIKFIFVGTLSVGKQPIYALMLIEKLLKKQTNIYLEIYGEGLQHVSLQNYIYENKLEKHVFLKGNQNQETIKKAYIESHFIILPSKSEGWPKVIAEGMFWGCLPISTPVSCVPNMLDYGNRGILLDMNLENDVFIIENSLNDNDLYQEKVQKAFNWSRKYTTDFFESEIKKLVS